MGWLPINSSVHEINTNVTVDASGVAAWKPYASYDSLYVWQGPTNIVIDASNNLSITFPNDTTGLGSISGTNVERINVGGTEDHLITGNNFNNMFRFTSTGSNTLNAGGGQDFITIGRSVGDLTFVDYEEGEWISLDRGWGFDPDSFASQLVARSVTVDESSYTYFSVVEASIGDKVDFLKVHGDYSVDQIHLGFRGEAPYSDGNDLFFTLSKPAPAFDVVLSSTFGNVATFEVYATEVADSGDPGLEDFQFELSHGIADMTIDAASISPATGLVTSPNFDSSTGSLIFAGLALPPFTDLSTPILTFNATILNEAVPFSITIDNIIADDTNLPSVVEQFDFSSAEITTTLTDRFGNSLSDASVSAYETQVGDHVFLREVSTSDTSSVFEIVAKPTEAVSSIDFDLIDNVGLIDFQVGAALSGWSIQSNTSTPDTVNFAGFGAVDGSQDLVAGQESVLATFTTSIDLDFVIEEIFLNTTSQADIPVGEVEPLSQIGNITVHQVARGSDVYLNADKPIDVASDKSIKAYDALQALRLAVGLNKSDGTAEWHDFIAADINKDGQVTANDALNILKFVVGLTDGPSADWVFVDGDADWSGIGRRNTSYEEGIWLEDVVSDMSVNMTSILVGDVDGSFVA